MLKNLVIYGNQSEVPEAGTIQHNRESEINRLAVNIASTCKVSKNRNVGFQSANGEESSASVEQVLEFIPCILHPTRRSSHLYALHNTPAVLHRVTDANMPDASAAFCTA